MNLIFVKNLGFSIVCERFPYLYLLGRAKPDHVLPSFIENGAPPHLLGAVRLPPAPLLLCLHPHRNLCAATSVATPPAPSQGLEGIMIRCIGIAYAVMGTRQRFPEVRTAFGVPPRHLQNV